MKGIPILFLLLSVFGLSYCSDIISFGAQSDFIAQGFSFRYINKMVGGQIYGRFYIRDADLEWNVWGLRVLKMFRIERRLKPYVSLTLGYHEENERSLSSAVTFGVEALIIKARSSDIKTGISLSLEVSMGYIGHSGYGGPFPGVGIHYNF